MSEIHTILFDADGVLQRPAELLEVRMRRVMDQVPDGLPKDLDRFHVEVEAAERLCLLDQADYGSAMRDLLVRWGVPHTAEAFVDGWFHIEPEAALLRLVEGLRECGLRCVVASNQERNRARYMSEILGYAETFDDQFYSCHLGAAKPDHAFFARALELLALEPHQVLFIDDRSENVEGAREMGLHGARFALGEADEPARRMTALLRSFGLPV